MRDLVEHEPNIVLTGFMGTGKTTAGRLLAERLGMEFVDTDELLEERHGPIAEIFETRGEAAFRELEHALAEELSDRRGVVISTGGRMMLDADNVTALSRTGRVFCLVATPDEIFDRVSSDADRTARPLLLVPDPKSQIIELMNEREVGYRRFPQLTTSEISPEHVAQGLAELVTSDPHRYAIASPGGEYHYSVGAGILPFHRQLARIEGPSVVVTNETVAEHYLPSCGDVDLAIVLPAGADQKTVASVQAVHDRLLDAQLDRSATVVSLGDSIVGDVAAFAAATYMRGVDLVHCPTDLIAMVDTSVGGKVGLDVPQGKNLIGLFKQPAAVIADVATLQTLSPREFSAGMGEVLKHGLISGADALARIETGHWRDEGHRLPGALGDLQALVAQAVQIKIAVIQEDPYDENRRQILNLGHTFAHAFELVDDGDLMHGEAVGVGLVAAARLSARLGYSASDLPARVEELVRHVGLRPALPRPLDPSAVMAAMARDKKRRASQQRFVILRDIGDPIVTAVDDLDVVDAVVRSVQPERE